MPFSFFASSNLRPQFRGLISAGRTLVCSLCVVGLLLPAATLMPFAFLQQFRMQSEEDVHTGETDAEATEERRRNASPPKRRCLPANRQEASGRPQICRAVSDRSEFRRVNGTGAPLRC